MQELSLVDRSSDLPLHIQVRRRILEMIQHAPLDETLALPSESELIVAFGVSRMTVRRALADLVAAGYVVRQAGKGSFALPRKLLHTSGESGGLWNAFRAQGFTVRAQVIRFDMKAVNAEIALQLRVPEGTNLPYLKRVTIVDEKPISVVRAYLNLPAGCTPTVEDMSSEPLGQVLHRKWGITPTRAVRTMEASLATQDDLELLELSPPAALLIAERVNFDATGRAITHVTVRYDSTLYKYVQETDSSDVLS